MSFEPRVSPVFTDVTRPFSVTFGRAAVSPLFFSRTYSAGPLKALENVLSASSRSLPCHSADVSESDYLVRGTFPTF